MRMTLASEGVSKVDLLEQSTQLIKIQEDRKFLEKAEGLPRKFMVMSSAETFTDFKKYF